MDSKARYVSKLAAQLNSSGQVPSSNYVLDNSGVTPGSYGSASQIPVFAVDSKGRVTSASTVAVAGVSTFTYNTSTGRFTIGTADGASYTADFTLAPFSTTTLAEGTNQYFTTARARASISATGSLSYSSSTGVMSFTQGNTDTIAEGATNLYYTDARVRAAISATGSLSYNSTTGVFSYTQGSTDTVSEGTTNLYYTAARVNTAFDTRLATKSTSNLAEGSNLYYTDARVGSYLTTNSYATQTYVNTQVSNLVAAAPTTLDTLNELATALGNDPSFATTVSTNIGTKAAKATTVSAGTGLSGGGDLSANRTISLANTTVVAGTYGSSTAIPVIAVNAQGQITSASNTSITVGDGAMTVTAGTGLSGGGQLGTANQTGASSVTLSLGTVGTAGTYTKVTTDAYGRVTAGTTLSASVIPSLSATYLPLTGGTLSGALTIGVGNNLISTATWEKLKLVTTGVTAAARQGSDGNGLNFTSNALYAGAWSNDDATKKSMAYIQHLGNGRHEFRTSPAGASIAWVTSLTVDETGATITGNLNTSGYIQTNASGIKWDQSGVRSWSMYPSGGNLLIASGDSAGTLTFNGGTVYHSGNLTNLNQLTNGPGYLTGTKVDSISGTSPIVASASTGAVTLSHAASGVTAGTYNNVTVNSLGHVTGGSNTSYLTSYTETDTLATVTARGQTTTNNIYSSAYVGSSVVHIRNDSLEDRITASDTGGVAVNYYGYSVGTSYFRNFIVYDGKGAEKFKVTGSTGAVTIAGNTALHAANYSSYALPLSGGTLNAGSGTYATHLNLGPSGTYNITLMTNIGGGGGYMGGTVAGDSAIFSSAATGGLTVGSHNGGWIRFGNGGSLNMSGSPTVLGNAIIHAANYSSYALPISGGSLTTSASSNIFIGRNSTATNYNAVSLNGNSADSSNMGLTGGGTGDSTLYVNSPGNIQIRTNGFGQTTNFTSTGITWAGNQIIHTGNPQATTEWYHSGRDFANGTLITTSIDYSQVNGDPFVLQIRGNTYGSQMPCDIQWQGYIYGSTIINTGGYSVGANFQITAMNVGGYLCFWFARQAYWQGFNVHVYTAYGPRAINKVTAISDVVNPNGSKQVTFTPTQVLRSDNFSNYALSLSGGGVSGDVGILRRRLTFSSSSSDANHSIYNNYNNIDGEGSFDGMKMNVYAGLRVRVGNASGATPTQIFSLDSTGVTIGRDIYVSGQTGGSYGNRLVVGATSTSYTLQDTNIRPTIQANGSYPVISLNNTQSTNTRHGPIIQFTNNGVGSQFVIGTNGTGTQLDFGTSSTADWNPHNGIDNYSGTTALRINSSGYVYMKNRVYFENSLQVAAGIILQNSGATYDNSTGARLTENYGPYWNLTNSATWHYQIINGSFLCGIAANGGNFGGGNILASGNITAYYSDERLKTKVTTITNALDKVKSLEGFIYVENELAKSLGYENKKEQSGLSAQQVQIVLPQAVSLAPFDMQGVPETGEIISKSGENYLTVQYDRLVPLLIEAIKEQQDIIESQEARIARLEALVETLINKVGE